MNDLIRASALLTSESEEDIVEEGEDDVGRNVGEDEDEDEEKGEDGGRMDMDMDAEMDEWQ